MSSAEPTPFFLTTDRIGFRAWRDEDFDLAIGLWGDPRVMELLGGPYDGGRVRARLESESASLTQCGGQYWPIFLRETGDYLGCCGLHPWTFSPSDGGLELGFHFKPDFWGQGFAKEAAAAAIRFGFDELGLPCILAGHHPSNQASSAVLLNLGFERRTDVFYPPTGLMHPTYRLTRDAWILQRD